MRADVAYRSLIVVAAWVSLAAIAYATMTQVGFVYSLYYRLYPILFRPEMRAYAHFEHVFAFAVLGALFCFAYPRHFVLVSFLVFGSAAIFEILQTLTPDRHGTVIDAAEKIGGGAIGILGARILLRFSQHRLAP
jgi:VanZ family protein